MSGAAGLPGIAGTTIAKMIPRLASNHDGEVLAVARGLQRVLAGAGLDLHDLAAAVASEPSADPQSWGGLIDFCLDRRDHLNAKEIGFLVDIRPRLVLGGQPSERQAAWLRDIHGRVWGTA